MYNLVISEDFDQRQILNVYKGVLRNCLEMKEIINKTVAPLIDYYIKR